MEMEIGNGIKSGNSNGNKNGIGTNNHTPTRTEHSWEEVTISVPWGVVTGKWWGNRNKQPVLALHGWQDNAGTFDKLCVLLDPNIPIYCIDLPGHGKSSPYPTGMQYFLFWDGIALIRRIVRKYDWKNIVLMGHSLGGALSFMYSASFPKEVSKLISLDIAGPSIRDHKKLASMTGHCIDKFLDYENLAETKMPRYDYNEMIKLVLDAYDGSVDLDGVKILMKRGMSALPQHISSTGYHFSRDLRLKVSMLGMFSEEQVLSYAEKITCKVLNIRADSGLKLDKPESYEKVIDEMKKNATVIYEKVPGTHHVHLVNPESIKDIINNFLHM